MYIKKFPVVGKEKAKVYHMPRKNCMSEKRELILQAFGQCMRDQDIETVGVREIAAVSGVPSGSIHYYFKSKCEIMNAYFQRILEEERALLSRWADEISPEISSIAEFCDAFIDLLEEQKKSGEGMGGFCYLHFYAMIIKYSEVRQIMTDFYREMIKEIARALRNTKCACSDPEMLAMLLIIQRDGMSFIGEMNEKGDAFYESVFSFIRRDLTGQKS